MLVETSVFLLKGTFLAQVGADQRASGMMGCGFHFTLRRALECLPGRLGQPDVDQPCFRIPMQQD
jgi:hypothetical protein